MYGDDREPVPEKPAIVRRAFAGDNKGFHCHHAPEGVSFAVFRATAFT